MNALRARLAVLLLVLAAPLTTSGQDLANLARLKDYTAERISSFDREGDNADGNHKNPIAPGETRVIGDVEGPGIINHIWVAFPSNEPHHLKKSVLRM